MSSSLLSRRAFLRRSAAASMAGVAAPLALQLSHIAEAAAAASTDDYKALVCVFLQGGNDHANTLVPVDPEAHRVYAAARGALALPMDDLPATRLPARVQGQLWATAPALAPLLPEFVDGRLAWLGNIGPLVRPTTLADYRARRVPLPPRLFSHNDQQSVWQSGQPEGALSGWGGRAADAVLSGNSQAALTCMNLAGQAVFLAGTTAVPYMLSPSGVPALAALEGGLFGSAACVEAFRSLVTDTAQPHLFAAEHARTMARAIDVNARLRSALVDVPSPVGFNLSEPLGLQLAMVARLMAARGTLGLRRQVFFVQLGGFDLHDNLTARHPALLAQVASALVAFQAEVDRLGLANQVTTFTASDFGRTLTGNGDGSDHGWGGHHLVLGGAVRGGQVYGTLPPAGLDGEHHVGQGRLLPTLAVQQLGASLASWFGVPASELPQVVPGIEAFDGAALAGLMAA